MRRPVPPRPAQIAPRRKGRRVMKPPEGPAENREHLVRPGRKIARRWHGA